MIGGKVLDPSALAALARGNLAAATWLTVAGQLGIVLYVPSQALTEVVSVRPDAGPLLADLLAHPSVVRGDLDVPAGHQVEQRMQAAGDGIYDGTAGHVVHVAQTRGWPVLTTDPQRLHRIEPHTVVEMV